MSSWWCFAFSPWWSSPFRKPNVTTSCLLSRSGKDKITFDNVFQEANHVASMYLASTRGRALVDTIMARLKLSNLIIPPQSLTIPPQSLQDSSANALDVLYHKPFLPSAMRVALPTDSLLFARFKHWQTISFGDLASLPYMSNLDDFLDARWPFPLATFPSLPFWIVWSQVSNEGSGFHIALSAYSILALLIDLNHFVCWKRRDGARKFNLGLLLMLYGEDHVARLVGA